jgi:hypothetical protein
MVFPRTRRKLSHHHIPDPVKEVAAPSFGVMGMAHSLPEALYPTAKFLVLPKQLASTPSQNSSATQSLPRVRDPAEKESATSCYIVVDMASSLPKAHSPVAKLPMIPKQTLALSPPTNPVDDSVVPCSSSSPLWEISPTGDMGEGPPLPIP